jgi:hypothetical protein
MMQNRGVLKLRPFVDMSLQVQTPDGRSHFAPVRIMEGSTVLADMAQIPFRPQDEIVHAQLVMGRGEWRTPVDIPIADFRWSAQSHPPEFYAAGAHARLRSELATYREGEKIRVAWSDAEGASKYDWIGVFAENAPPGMELRGDKTHGAAQGHMQLEPIPRGRYVLRLVAADVRRVVAVSEPFEVR